MFKILRLIRTDSVSNLSKKNVQHFELGFHSRPFDSISSQLERSHTFASRPPVTPSRHTLLSHPIQIWIWRCEPDLVLILQLHKPSFSLPPTMIFLLKEALCQTRSQIAANKLVTVSHKRWPCVTVWACSLVGLRQPDHLTPRAEIWYRNTNSFPD